MLFISENRDIMIKTGGEEALRDGKSLHMSGHVKNLQYHGVAEAVMYCFIKALVVRETSTSKNPYSCWAIVHKVKGLIVDVYCSCPAG